MDFGLAASIAFGLAAAAALSLMPTDEAFAPGNALSHSPPVPVYSVIATAQATHFKPISDHGGINGRPI